MRDIKELLKLLLTFVKEHECYKTGLCWATNQLFDEDIISKGEEALLYDYINKNKPIYARDRDWGWKPGLKEPRIKWLKEEINKLNI